MKDDRTTADMGGSASSAFKFNLTTGKRSLSTYLAPDEVVLGAPLSKKEAELVGLPTDAEEGDKQKVGYGGFVYTGGQWRHVVSLVDPDTEWPPPEMDQEPAAPAYQHMEL